MTPDNFFTENPADITWLARRSHVRVYMQDNGLRQTETIDGTLYAARFFPRESATYAYYWGQIARHENQEPIS